MSRKRPRDGEPTVLEAVRAVCMIEPTQEQIASFPPALTPLDQQVLSLRLSLPSTFLLLVVCGYKVKFYGRDSRVASRRLGIMCVPTSPFESSSFPVQRLPHYLARLTEMGYHVAVADQVETAALRAVGGTSSGKVFQRSITAVYSRATTSSATFEALYASGGISLSLAEGDGQQDDAEENRDEAGDDRCLPASASSIVVDVTLRYVLVVHKSDNIWRCQLMSFVAMLCSDVFEADTDAVAHVLRDVFLRVEPCEVVCEVSCSADVEALLRLQVGVSRLHMGPTTDGSEDDCTVVLTTVPPRESSATALGAALTFAERFHLGDCIAGMRRASFQQCLSGGNANRAMCVPPTTLEALHILRDTRVHTGAASTSMSLLQHVDTCVTKAGSRTLRSWITSPLVDVQSVRERQEAAAMTVSDTSLKALVESVRVSMKGYLTDAEATLGRLLMHRASVSELIALVQLLQRLCTAAKAALQTEASGADGRAAPARSWQRDNKCLDNYAQNLIHQDVSKLVEVVANSINMAASTVSDVFDGVAVPPETIRCIREGIAAAERRMDHELVVAREELGMPTLQFSTVAGVNYLLDIPQTRLVGKKIPHDWIIVSRTKTNARYHTAGIVEASSQLAAERDKLSIAAGAEWTAFQQMLTRGHCGAVAAAQEAFRAAGALDAIGAIGRMSQQPGYTVPAVGSETQLCIRQGRHPMLDARMGGTYTAADVVMSSRGGTWLLTGPNMGGKSALMRMVGIFSILAQSGCAVPAAFCSMPVFEAVYCRMGLEDSVLEQQSTFMREMLETKAILTSPLLPQSLVLIDELGQGTSSFDGLAVAHGTLEFLRKHRATTFFVTHHSALCAPFLAAPSPEVQLKYMSFCRKKNISEDASDERETICFLHVPVDGVSPSSFGVEVAAMAGLPASVIHLARQKSQHIEAQQQQRELLHQLAQLVRL